MTIQWRIAEMGRVYETVGAPGGEWQLTWTDPVYTLAPAGSCRGIEISGQHGLYYALDVAGEYVERVMAK